MRVPTWQERLALEHTLQLVEHGWTQGAYYRSATGGSCEPEDARRYDLAGALQQAATQFDVDVEKLRGFVLHELGAEYQADMLGVERWNDSPLRIRTDVIRLLMRLLWDE